MPIFSARASKISLNVSLTTPQSIFHDTFFAASPGRSPSFAVATLAFCDLYSSMMRMTLSTESSQSRNVTSTGFFWP